VQHPPARIDFACRNCGTPAPLKFCPECGQETTLHPPSLGEFLHEFIGHYVALEGALWRTLGLLVRRPGKLTREYLEGRRRRYVLPLRLYLTASFVFFLALKLTAASMGSEMVVKIDANPATAARYAALAAAAASGPAGHASALRHRRDCGPLGAGACSRVDAAADDFIQRFKAHPQETIEHLRTHLLALAPYVIFVLLPAFAGIMMLAYRARRMTYGEHFVFSLHLHAFWFLALMAIALVPDAVGDVLLLVVPVYGVWAMREAYGGRWLPTAGRALFVSLFYALVLCAASVALSVALLISG
jgi:hypothetical protein